jgi:hypothetical protein
MRSPGSSDTRDPGGALRNAADGCMGPSQPVCAFLTGPRRGLRACALPHGLEADNARPRTEQGGLFCRGAHPFFVGGSGASPQPMFPDVGKVRCVTAAGVSRWWKGQVRRRSRCFQMVERSGASSQSAFRDGGKVRCVAAVGVSRCWKRQVRCRSRCFQMLERSGASPQPACRRFWAPRCGRAASRPAGHLAPQPRRGGGGAVRASGTVMPACAHPPFPVG